ncbi:hypothetical protein ACOMHN_058679 [Nucella lapillus]
MEPARRLQQVQQILCRQGSFSASSNPQSIIIHVTPEVSRLDEKVCIRVQGLPSESNVTVHAWTESLWQGKAVQFGSCGHYVTSSTGEVDLGKDASVGGTYTGVESMGLFWSMAGNPFGPKNSRMVIRNVEKPVSYKLSVYQDHLSLEDLFKDSLPQGQLASRTLERQVLQTGVRRIPVQEGKLRGVIFLPPGEGPFPGVVDLFGMAGGLMEGRAAMLASHGFASYALPYFGYKDLPASVEEQTFDYFEEAARWFGSHPSVAPGGIGVMGVSAGAGFALMMAYRCPQVKAVVRINAQGFHGMMEVEDKECGGRYFNAGVMLDRDKCTMTEEGLVMKDAWVLDDDHIIPLWEKDVPVLVLVCDDDGQVHSEKSDEFRQWYPEGRRDLVEVVHYPGAGHLLEPPFTPHCRTCYNPFFGGAS